MNRRYLLKTAPFLTFANKINIINEYPISCNSYNWYTFYGRVGKDWGKDLNADIENFSRTGLKAYEPSITSVEMAEILIPILNKNAIKMPSIYVNSVLHLKDEIETSINQIINIAKTVKKYGTKIIVTNPNPLQWGGNEVKSDEQLILQAAALNKLGKLLKVLGMKLAYHTHDMEMLAGAREFHHMLQNTEATNMGFCFDIHWIYRGSKNSNLAVFDILKIYGKRILELHVRQSTNNIWNETFTIEGDIDYRRFANELKKMNITPHIVLEQCLEEKSPNKFDVVEAHQIGLKNLTKLFF